MSNLNCLLTAKRESCKCGGKLCSSQIYELLGLEKEEISVKVIGINFSSHHIGENFSNPQCYNLKWSSTHDLLLDLFSSYLIN